MRTYILEKRKFVLSCILLAFITAPALAQKEGKKFSFGFGIEAMAPVGNEYYKNNFQVGAGITVRGSYKMGPGYITLTTGAIFFAPAIIDFEQLDGGLEIPVRAGYKYIFLKHLFVHGEVGYARFNTIYTDSYQEVHSTGTGGFVFSPTVGANWGVFEVGIRYEGLAGTKQAGYADPLLSTVGIRVGFNF